MALQASLDYALQVVREPGYFQHITNDALAQGGDPTAHSWWWEQAFGTLMLYPLQLALDFKDTAAQLDSIIGLVDRGSGSLQISADDITNRTIFEANYKQNENNPWVFFSPVTAFGAPTALETPTGLTGQGSLTSMDVVSERNFIVSPVISTTPKCLAFTKEVLPGNQALYLRWYVPPSGAGHQTIYWFMIGQLCITCQGNVVQAHEDISTGGDRTAWRYVGSWPLFSGGYIRNAKSHGRFGSAKVNEDTAGDRGMLFLPFRRHWVYLETSEGTFAAFPTRNFPRGNGLSGTDEDWDITAARNMSVWALSQSTGQFQIQKVKYQAGPQALNAPHFVLDYTPTNPLTGLNILDDVDKWHGTTVSHSTPANPPGYDLPENSLDTCPPPTTGTGDETRTYGVTFTMTASADARWTPFFYGYDIRIDKVAGMWPNSPTLVSDVNVNGARVVEADFTASLERGESELTVHVVDGPTPTAESQYYRAEVPIALIDGATTLFVGITDPTEVVAPRFLVMPRRVEFKAHDLWKLLEDSTLRDQRDWGPQGTVKGTGHITVVDFIARQAGIDTTGADYAKGPADISALNGIYDFPLGGVMSTVGQSSQELIPPWKPKNDPPDTAASFIERIAKLFSGWDVGFDPNGTFFYRPKDWYKGTGVGADTVVVFHKESTSAFPRYYRDVEFRNVEPELNVLQIGADGPNDGSLLLSSRWVDRASINNPLAPNFMGRWKAGYARLSGAYSCGELNRVASVLWNEARKRKLMVKFTAEYTPSLKLGHCFRLDDYELPLGIDAIFRMQNVKAHYKRHSWHSAVYEGQFLEAGHL